MLWSVKLRQTILGTQGVDFEAAIRERRKWNWKAKREKSYRYTQSGDEARGCGGSGRHHCHWHGFFSLSLATILLRCRIIVSMFTSITDLGSAILCSSWQKTESEWRILALGYARETLFPGHPTQSTTRWPLVPVYKKGPREITKLCTASLTLPLRHACPISCR